MAENNLNPVRPGETPPVPTGGAETFPVQPQSVPVAQPLDVATTPVPESRAAVTPTRSIFDAVSTPGMEATGNVAVAEREREKANWAESAVAGARAWTTTDVYKWLTAPDFEPGDANIGNLIAQVDIPLTASELEYLQANRSKSVEEHEYRLNEIKNQREIGQLIGDNAVIGAMAGFMDPVWWITGGTGALVGAAVRGGRTARFLAGAGTDAAITTGLDTISAEQRPMEDMERVINLISGSLLGGAAAVMVPPRHVVAPGRAVPKGGARAADPTFPADDLADAASAIPPRSTLDDVELRPNAGGVGDDLVPTGPKVDTPAGARDIPGSVSETQSVPRWDVHYSRTPIPKGSVKQTARQAIRSAVSSTKDPVLREFLAGMERRLGSAADKLPVYVKDGEIVRGRPQVMGYYDVGGNRLQLRANQPGWVLAHELAHAMTVNKLAYGKKNRNTTLGRITTELEDLFEKVRPELSKAEGGVTPHLAKDLDEFVAGIYTQDPRFIEALSRIPDPGNPRRSTLGRLVDAVRRLIGLPLGEMNGFLRALQLSEELMDQPLRVIYHRPKGSNRRITNVEMTREEALRAATKEADDTFNEAKKYNEKLAEMGSWNFHKTMKGFDEEVADILLDNPLTQNRDSADSWVRSIRADFTAKQRVYEDALRDIQIENGQTFWKMVFKPQEYRASQQRIESMMQRELDFRNQMADLDSPDVRGAPGIPDKIVDLADKYEDAMRAAHKELVDSGVFGASDVIQQRGYYPHRWSARKLTEVENRLMSAGHTQEAVTASLRAGFSRALQKANPEWTPDLADKVGKAMVDRMARRADLSDATFRAHIGNAEIATIADMLEGIDPGQRQRVLDALSGVRDDANRASYLKSRLKIDLEHGIELPDGSTTRLGDMLESNLTNLMEHYLDDAAGRAAFARMGMPTATDIEKLKVRMAQTMRSKNAPEVELRRAEELFINVVDLLHGRPVGTNFAWGYRMLQAVTQMVGLGAAGIWQITEYAKLLQKYGLRKSLGMFRKSFTYKEHFSQFTPEQAGRLENILSRNAYQDIRIRPMVEKLEDGFDIPVTHSMLLRLQAAKQAVPYFNAMKWIQRHQSNLVGNLVTDTLLDGAKGNARARRILNQYGLNLDDPLMGDVISDILKHGADTNLWREGTWDAVRNGLNRMVDDSVLRARRGETPAFAQVSDLGRFIFTFRSFVLSAHNKTLAGTLNRDGFMGLGLLLSYQFPLSYIAVMANNVRTGRDMTDEQLLNASVSMMGGIGLGSELWGVLTGEKQQFGAPGLIAGDRIYAAGAALSSWALRDGSGGKAAAAMMNAFPLLPLAPAIAPLQDTLRNE